METTTTIVSNDGTDTFNCGSNQNPCQTLKYAIMAKKSISIYLIDGNDYQTFVYNVGSIELPKNFTLTGAKGTNNRRPIINAIDNRTAAFSFKCKDCMFTSTIDSIIFSRQNGYEAMFDISAPSGLFHVQNSIFQNMTSCMRFPSNQIDIKILFSTVTFNNMNESPVLVIPFPGKNSNIFIDNCAFNNSFIEATIVPIHLTNTKFYNTQKAIYFKSGD